jgi:hypothetical protein
MPVQIELGQLAFHIRPRPVAVFDGRQDFPAWRFE